MCVWQSISPGNTVADAQVDDRRSGRNREAGPEQR